MKYFAQQSESGNWQDICELVPESSFAGALRAVETGKADCAVLPIENSSTGSILTNFDLITDYGFYITGEYSISVAQCLMAKPGVTMDQITEVLSHEQGLAQSREFLARHPWKQTAVYNTAYAASWSPSQNGGIYARLHRRRAAEIYGLNILAERTNFKDINQTRFVILSREVHHSPDNNKVSLMVTLPHVPGSLCRLLSILHVKRSIF